MSSPLSTQSSTLENQAVVVFDSASPASAEAASASASSSSSSLIQGTIHFEAGQTSSTSRFQVFKARYQGFDSYAKQVMDHNNVFDSLNSGETRGRFGTAMAKVCHVVMAAIIDIGRYIAYVVKGGKFDNQDSKFLKKKEGEYTYSWNRSIDTKDKATKRVVALAKEVMKSAPDMYATQLLGGAKIEGPALFAEIQKGLDELPAGVSRFEFFEKSLSEVEGALKTACVTELPGYSVYTDVISLRDQQTPLANDLFKEILNATGSDAAGRSKLRLLRASAKIYDIRSDFNTDLAKENSSAVQAQNKLVSQLNQAVRDNIINKEQRDEALADLRAELIDDKSSLSEEFLKAAVNDAVRVADTQDASNVSSGGVVVEDITNSTGDDEELFYDVNIDGEDLAKALVKVDALTPFRSAASQVAQELAGEGKLFKFEHRPSIVEAIAQGLKTRAEVLATREKQKAEEAQKELETQAAKTIQKTYRRHAAKQEARKETGISLARTGLSRHLSSTLELLKSKENELSALLGRLEENITKSTSNLEHVQTENGRAHFSLNKALELSDRIVSTPADKEINFDGILENGISLKDIIKNVEQHLNTEEQIVEEYESILGKINEKNKEIESIKEMLLIKKDQAKQDSDFEADLEAFNQSNASHLEMFKILVGQKQGIEAQKTEADFQGLKVRLGKLNEDVEKHRQAAAKALAKSVNNFSDEETFSSEEAVAKAQEKALKAAAVAKARNALQAAKKAFVQKPVVAPKAQGWGNYLWSFVSSEA